MHRNHDWTETRKYSARLGQDRADFERTTKGAQLKIGNDHEFIRVLEDLILNRKLSPAAALSTIKRENIKLKTEVSLRTLYHYIDMGLFPHLTNKHLPYRGKRQNAYRKVKPVKSPPRGTPIDKRPAVIDGRGEFGHWEMDSVIGKSVKGETLLVFTERKTRFELIFRSKDKTAASTVCILNKLEQRFGRCAFKAVFKSITCDNGPEFSDHYHMELSIFGNSQRTKVYYCHPYCSFERGSNENQNRIIRRFIKKGTAIATYSDAKLIDTQDYLNNMPRKILAWKTASELFFSELAALGIKYF